jgi:hypothetical protein
VDLGGDHLAAHDAAVEQPRLKDGLVLELLSQNFLMSLFHLVNSLVIGGNLWIISLRKI